VTAEAGSARRARRGLVIGELLVGFLLLAVAVSSLAALMYSVSSRPGTQDQSACVETKTDRASSKCATRSAANGTSKLLRSGCTAKTGTVARGCDDSTPTASARGETILRSRTDSASLALLAKKQKSPRPAAKPYRGFIR